MAPPGKKSSTKAKKQQQTAIANQKQTAVGPGSPGHQHETRSSPRKHATSSTKPPKRAKIHDNAETATEGEAYNNAIVSDADILPADKEGDPTPNPYAATQKILTQPFYLQVKDPRP